MHFTPKMRCSTKVRSYPFQNFLVKETVYCKRLGGGGFSALRFAIIGPKM